MMRLIMNSTTTSNYDNDAILRSTKIDLLIEINAARFKSVRLEKKKKKWIKWLEPPSQRLWFPVG